MSTRDDSFAARVVSRASDVMAQEAGSVWAARQYLGENMVQAVRVLLDAEGKVLTTGMGKAGHVARRLAAVLCSTGTPAVFLHPGEASHGDLGVVSPGDPAVVFSHSGKTREVNEAVAQAQAIGLGAVVAVTAHPGARVARLADVTLYMGEVEEAGPHGLVPSASTAVMGALADALALCVMEARGTTAEDFGARHHGGYLGRQANDREER